MFWSPVQTHVTEGDSNGTRRDYDHFVALFLKATCCFDYEREN